MRIADNVEMLEFGATLTNGPGAIHPVLIWDDRDVVLFDAGLPGMGAAVREACVQTGIPFERLNHILITHSDMDHIGSLAEIIQAAGAHITVTAHREEKPYIECEKEPVRLRQMEAAADTLQGDMREQMKTLSESLRQNYRKFCVQVDKTAEDTEILPICGGITAIYTPGHTPGHMCYYMARLKLLIAGDILQAENGALKKCPDFTTMDQTAVTESLKKLAQYPIETVVCYHGGVFFGNASEIIAKIAET